MSHRYRPEWVDEPRVLATADEPAPTLDTFAYSDTVSVLAAEPALVALAGLVERARPTDGEWRGVDRIASVLLGPQRRAEQVGPMTAMSLAIRPVLHSETTRQRYIAALRAAANRS